MSLDPRNPAWIMLILYVSLGTADYNVRFSKLSAQLDRQTRLICDALPMSECRVTNGLRMTLAQLMSRQGHDIAGLYNQIRNIAAQDAVIPEIRGEPGKPSGTITALFEMCNVSKSDEILLRTSINKSLVESLRYPAMSNRYESLAEPHLNTFEWAFIGMAHRDSKWTNLATWLKEGAGVY